MRCYPELHGSSKCMLPSDFWDAVAGQLAHGDNCSIGIRRITWKPQKGPKAAVTHATYPLFSGNVVANSAVIRASGTLQMRGRIRNPRIASSGPPALTASCNKALHAVIPCLPASVSRIQCQADHSLYLCSKRTSRDIIEDERHQWQQRQRLDLVLSSSRLHRSFCIAEKWHTAVLHCHRINKLCAVC